MVYLANPKKQREANIQARVISPRRVDWQLEKSNAGSITCRSLRDKKLQSLSIKQNNNQQHCLLSSFLELHDFCTCSRSSADDCRKDFFAVLSSSNGKQVYIQSNIDIHYMQYIFENLLHVFTSFCTRLEEMFFLEVFLRPPFRLIVLQG